MRNIHDIEKNFIYCHKPEEAESVLRCNKLFDIMPPSPDGFLNYYHFICQHLPRIYYAKILKKKEFGEMPLFFKAHYYNSDRENLANHNLPSEKFRQDCTKNPMLKKFFSIMGVSNDDFLIPKRKDILSCKERFYIPDYNILKSWRGSEEGLNFYKEYFNFLKLQGVNDHTNRFDVVLIRRRQGNKLTPNHVKGASFGVRTISNFEQLESFLNDWCEEKGLSFGVHDRGSDNFITADAKILIGVHGAGLTNMAFCREGAHIIELAAEDFLSGSRSGLYANMAKSLGRKYSPLSCKYSDKGHEVDIYKIKKALDAK
tara:strand:+ start:379 stop:1323 length:945 start_codon:yes stop_codon:yes gene_type:complete